MTPKHESIQFHEFKKPTSVDEFIRCLIREGWDPSVVFDAGSKYCLKLKPQLLRECVGALRKQSDLSRYTRAMSKLVRLSDDDAALTVAWRANLPQLRSLLYTSPSGTDRQRARLFEISVNKQVVAAMLYALRQEREIVLKKIEISWIAVLYAEGSDASVREANRFNVLLGQDKQDVLQMYRRGATVS